MSKPPSRLDPARAVACAVTVFAATPRPPRDPASAPGDPAATSVELRGQPVQLRRETPRS